MLTDILIINSELSSLPPLLMIKPSSFLRRVSTLACLAAIGFGSAFGSSLPAEGGKCMMWKATNGTNVVYLLGSIHIGSKKMYPLAKPIEDAYSASKTLVVEVNLNKVNPMDSMGYVTEVGMYKGDDNLWKHIKPATTDRVKEFCQTYGMAPTMLGMFKPWLVSVELEVLPLQKAGMDLNLGIDKYFLDRAAKPNSGKTVEQIEDAQFQLKLLSALPEDESDEYLTYSMGESKSQVQEEPKLESLWLNGNADEMDKVTSQLPDRLKPFMRKLLQDRNPHMADVAEKFLKSGEKCFFVVGTAHLVGQEGVIALLKKRGYSVFQVDAKP